MKKDESVSVDFNRNDSAEDDFNRIEKNEGGGIERGYAPFARDKRKRVTKIAAQPVRRDRDGGSERRHDDWQGNRTGERRSYNPNFTEDNKLRRDSDDNFNREDYRRGGYGERPRTSGRSGAPYHKSGERRDGDPQRRYNNDGNRREGYPKKSQGYNKDSRYSKEGGGKRDSFGQGRGDNKRKPTFDKHGRRADGSYPKFATPPAVGDIRLNRYIAAAGICSRREADENITLGLVSVNGEIVTELGTKVKPGDEVRFNGVIVRGEKKVYIVMNKPKGYVTTMEDPHADKTVMDLLKDACSERVYPVGRLDKNSLGVLLFTNDGDLTKQLIHPAYNKKKIYQVTLDKPLTKASMEELAKGVMLDDGEAHADEISYVNDNKREIGLEIHSGRNRVVRRMFEAVGYKVQKLDRVYFAGLTKKNLKRGAWRFLNPREVQMLQSGMYE
jgi:23S rRNA pseudouridine2605 synthase